MSRTSRVLLIALALLVVIGAGSVFFAMRNEVNGGSAGANKEACELLTLDEAKELLNETAKKSDSSDIGTQETTNLKTTQCNYVTQGAGLHDTWTVNLEVRIAKNGAGETLNKAYFPPNKTDGQQVAGYGDEALWDEYSGLLTILRDDNFYGVRMTKGVGGNTVTLSEVQKAAEAAGLKD